jgi:hypothetical protein
MRSDEVPCFWPARGERLDDHRGDPIRHAAGGDRGVGTQGSDIDDSATTSSHPCIDRETASITFERGRPAVPEEVPATNIFMWQSPVFQVG